MELIQKYNPTMEYIWIEDGQKVGCMLGQFTMMTSHENSLDDLNRIADENYKDIICNCRHPEIILNFSDGCLMERWALKPAMFVVLARLYEGIMHYLQAKHDYCDFTFHPAQDYKSETMLKVFKNVNKKKNMIVSHEGVL